MSKETTTTTSSSLTTGDLQRAIASLKRQPSYVEPIQWHMPDGIVAWHLDKGIKLPYNIIVSPESAKKIKEHEYKARQEIR